MGDLMKRHLDNQSILFFVKLSGIVVIIQLLIIIFGVIVTAGIQAVPDSATGYFELMQESKLMGLLVNDFFSLLLVVSYLFTIPGLFLVLQRKNFPLTLLACLFMFSAVVLVISSHSGFSLMHLSDKYWAAVDETAKMQYIAAGEAIISQNIWNSTSGFFSGIFLQGGGVLISIAMLSSKNFARLTIYSGILANGLDLIQHLIHYSNQSFANIILYIAGPFYLVWYIVLARDLLKYVKIKSNKNDNITPNYNNI